VITGVTRVLLVRVSAPVRVTWVDTPRIDENVAMCYTTIKVATPLIEIDPEELAARILNIPVFMSAVMVAFVYPISS
jgi:hypothetical protein